MKKLSKDVLLGLAAGSLALAISCNELTIVEPFDPNAQFTEDLITIDTYITERGLDPVDTTVTSVRYAVTDAGEGDLVEVDDVITLDYTSYFAETGVLLGTSMQSVVDTAEQATVSEPLVFRHTINGWALNDLFKQRGGSTATNGFRDGLTAALNLGHNGIPEMLVGGTATILIPSKEIVVTIDGNTTRPQGFPNAVVAYEIAIRDVRK